MAWLAIRAKTACPGSRMRKGAIAESAVVLKRWAIFPAKEQALAHFEEGSIVELVDVGIRVAGWRVKCRGRVNAGLCGVKSEKVTLAEARLGQSGRSA